MRFYQMMAPSMERFAGFDGVYANADTLERCREELEEILEEWILLRVFKHLPLPTADGIDLTIKEVA